MSDVMDRAVMIRSAAVQLVREARRMSAPALSFGDPAEAVVAQVIIQALAWAVLDAAGPSPDVAHVQRGYGLASNQLADWISIFLSNPKLRELGRDG